MGNRGVLRLWYCYYFCFISKCNHSDSYSDTRMSSKSWSSSRIWSVFEQRNFSNVPLKRTEFASVITAALTYLRYSKILRCRFHLCSHGRLSVIMLCGHACLKCFVCHQIINQDSSRKPFN